MQLNVTHTFDTQLFSQVSPFSTFQRRSLQNEKHLDRNLRIFLILKNFLNSEEFLENSREISLLDLDLEAFSFHFSFSKRVNQIFSSLFTSRKKWKRFFFSLSLLELSIPTLAGHCIGVSFVCCLPHIFSPDKNATESWSGQCTAALQLSEREFEKERLRSFPWKNCVPDHPVVRLDNETGATGRLCHPGVTSRCQASSECHSDLSRNTFVFLQFARSYFTFSRAKRANRAKAFQSDNSSVSGDREWGFCNETYQYILGVVQTSFPNWSTLVDTFVEAHWR